MRRARLAVVIPTVLVSALVGAACDTDDGREMRPPTSEQRQNFEARNTTTTTSLFPTGSAVDALSPASDAPAASDAAAPTSAPATTAAAATSVAATSAAAASAATALQAPWADGAAIDARYTCDGAGEVPVISWAAPEAGVVELALAVTDDNAGGYVHWLVTGIPAAAGTIDGSETSAGVEQANSDGTVGWTGPCPPAGEVHTYRVALYSLTAPYAPAATEPPQNILGDIAGTAIGVVELTGTYQRPA